MFARIRPSRRFAVKGNPSVDISEPQRRSSLDWVSPRLSSSLAVLQSTAAATTSTPTGTSTPKVETAHTGQSCVASGVRNGGRVVVSPNSTEAEAPNSVTTVRLRRQTAWTKATASRLVTGCRTVSSVRLSFPTRND